MIPPSSEPLPPECALALAWTGASLRPRLEALLQLDRHLARLVARTHEPMLGQLRLAWWRDTLARPPAERPRGDAILDALGEQWTGSEAALHALIDGWEAALAPPPLSEAAARAFAEGRCTALLAVFAPEAAATPGAQIAAIRRAAWRWAMADFAARVSHADERALLIGLGLEGAGERTAPLTAPKRGLAVLGALGTRALRRGGRPLMEGRSAALIAWKAALLGR